MALLDRYYRNKKYKTPDQERIRRVLEETGDSWYSSLSDDGKERFEERCRKFIQDKRFISGDGEKVGTELKVRVAAKAVRLSFGLANFYFPRVHTVRLEEQGPDLEEADPSQGELVLTHPGPSEEEASEGFDRSLFEMAYGLYPLLDPAGEFERRFASYLEKWKKEGAKGLGVLSPRAKELFGELELSAPLCFALILERFLEDPKSLQKELAYLYYFYAFLLVLDPERQDGKFSKSSARQLRQEEGSAPDPERLGMDPKKRPGQAWMFFLGGGLLVGTVSNIILHNYSLISWPTHFILWGVIGTVVGFIQFDRIVRHQEIMNKAQFWIYSIVGPGNLFLAILLFLNHMVAITGQEKVVPFEKVGHARQGKFAVVEFSDEHSDLDDARIKVFDGDYFYSRPKKPNGLKVRIGRGVMGIQSIQERKLVNLEKFE